MPFIKNFTSFGGLLKSSLKSGFGFCEGLILVVDELRRHQSVARWATMLLVEFVFVATIFRDRRRENVVVYGLDGGRRPPFKPFHGRLFGRAVVAPAFLQKQSFEVVS